MHCNICGAPAQEPIERGEVRSNVRKFASERFGIWRCGECKSIHASDDVDLAHYYSDYPFHKGVTGDADWMQRAMFRNLLTRLYKADVDPDSSVIDFGCGSGKFLGFLRETGFDKLAGFDEYSEAYTDRGVLSQQYDCVMTQDVIEHVPEPLELVQTLNELAKPGGVIVIGTPNAESIDFANMEERVHTLHQPYHRHILSKRALLELGKSLGWTLLAYYPTMYSNTRIPFVNNTFVAHYFKCCDNNCDLIVEPIHTNNWKLYSPVTLAHAFFGSFYTPECDVQAIFQKPEATTKLTASWPAPKP